MKQEPGIKETLLQHNPPAKFYPGVLEECDTTINRYLKNDWQSEANFQTVISLLVFVLKGWGIHSARLLVSLNEEEITAFCRLASFSKHCVPGVKGGGFL